MIASFVEEKKVQEKNNLTTLVEGKESPLHGFVISIDRVYGVAFVKSDDERIFGLSNGLTTPPIWNSLKKGEKVSFLVNGSNSIEWIHVDASRKKAAPSRAHRDIKS